MQFKKVEPAKEPFKRSHRKEAKFYRSITAVCMDNELNPFLPFEVKFYKTATTVYCCVWFDLPNDEVVSTEHVSSAKVGGAGYCKENTALAEALFSGGLQIEGEPDPINVASDFIGHFWPGSLFTIIDGHA